MTILSCTDSLIIDPELDKIYSIEIYHSQSASDALILSNDRYPCISLSNCSPALESDLSITIRNNRLNPVTMQQNGISYHEDFPILMRDGDIISYEITLPDQNTITTTDTFPPDDPVLLDYLIYADTSVEGVYLLLDTVVLTKAHAFYVQLFEQANELPRFGFLIYPDQDKNTRVVNNGGFISTNIYYIPMNLVALSGVDLEPGDAYAMSVRSITSGSATFFEEFKKLQVLGTFNQNDGLYFAPPQNMPSNLPWPAFGFMHLFHEEVVTGIVQ